MAENTRRIAGLQREIAANPASRQFYQLGELLRRDGRWAEAADVLNAGLAHHPRYVAAWVALGRACLEGGKGSDAVRGLEEAIALDPQNPVAWRLVGEARLALGDRAAALDAMRRCLELVPGDDVLESAVEALAAEAPAPAGPVAAAPGAGARAHDAEPAAGADGHPVVAAVPPGEDVLSPFSESPFGAPAPREEATEVFGGTPAPAVSPQVAGVASETSEVGPFTLEEPATEPVGGFEFEPVAAPARAGEVPEPPASDGPPEAPAAEGPPEVGPATEVVLSPVETAGAETAAPGAGPEVEPEPRPAFDLAPSVAAGPTVEAATPAADDHLFTAPPAEEAPSLLKAVLTATAAKAASAPVQPPASLTLARLYVQQQALDDAVIVLERLLEREPTNIEAQDLLALVRDMMVPLPEAPPPLSARERKIAALQRWLASLTLGRERVAR